MEVTVTRSVSISIDELQAQDLKEMDKRDELEEVALKLLQRCNELSSEIKTLKSHPVASKAEEPTVVEATLFEVGIAPKAGEHKKKRRVPHGNGSTFGKKIGKTSKYHFVSVSKSGGFRASTSIKGKSVHMGKSKDEIECALLADDFLDSLNDKVRKRNRDDFREVAKAYPHHRHMQKVQS